MITERERMLALGIKCPMCGATPGRRCTTATGGTTRRPHIYRIQRVDPSLSTPVDNPSS
jgi:hypothetical protein